MAGQERIVSVLDIGSTRVKMLIASATGDTLDAILGVGTAPCNSLKRGIWQRLPGGGVVAIYIFVGSVTYRRRFDFERVAKESALRILPEEFEAAVDRVLRD